MIRTDRHRHLHSSKHVSQRTPAASPSNVIRMSARNASDFYSPQNFIRPSEPISEHKKSRPSNTNPMIDGVSQSPQRWEGSRPRDPLFPEPRASPDQGRKTPLASRTALQRARTRALPSSIPTGLSRPKITLLTTYVV
jgi:hypothetical protein